MEQLTFPAIKTPPVLFARRSEYYLCTFYRVYSRFRKKRSRYHFCYLMVRQEFQKTKFQKTSSVSKNGRSDDDLEDAHRQLSPSGNCRQVIGQSMSSVLQLAFRIQRAVSFSEFPRSSVEKWRRFRLCQTGET